MIHYNSEVLRRLQIAFGSNIEVSHTLWWSRFRCEWTRHSNSSNFDVKKNEKTFFFLFLSSFSTFHLILSCSIAKIEIPYHIYTQLTTCWWCHSSLLTRAILKLSSIGLWWVFFLLSFHFLTRFNLKCIHNVRCDACRSLSHKKKFNTWWKKNSHSQSLFYFLQV